MNGIAHQGNPSLTMQNGQSVTLKCIDCIAFRVTDNGGGECHKGPPSVVMVNKPGRLVGQMDQVPASVFPPAPPESWCLQFIPRPEPASTIATQ